MKRFLKFRHGERGFTLIELLVVVAILGVLAAVIIPNVAGFIGRGTVEAANTEAHNVQTAVVAYMADQNLADLDGSIPGDLSTTAGAFLLNVEGLQALYTITDGAITAATKITGSKWGDLVYTPGTGWAKPTTP